MANTRLLFGCSASEDVLECFINTKNEISIKISENGETDPRFISIVSLDVSTSIKLAKTIRTHINLIKKDLS